VLQGELNESLQDAIQRGNSQELVETRLEADSLLAMGEIYRAMGDYKTSAIPPPGDRALSGLEKGLGSYLRNQLPSIQSWRSSTIGKNAGRH
jgi:hypothetical protein